MHSLQVQTSSNNNQDEDFSEGHSPLMHMSSEKKKKQQQTQLINEAPSRQGYPLKDSYPIESSQISSHSKQQTLVTSTKGYPRKDDSPLNHQSSCPDLHQQQSLSKISTSQEYSSADDYCPNTQNTYHSPQQQLLAGTTSLQEQSPKGDSSGNLHHLLPSGKVHSPPKEKYPQECNQSFYPSTQQPSPVLAPSKHNHPRESNKSSQQPSAVLAPSKHNHPRESNQSSQQPTPVLAPSSKHNHPHHPRESNQNTSFGSLQVQTSGNNNQDEDFSEGHSPLMHMSSDKKKKQQQTQLINEAPSRQGYPLKDSHPTESSQISSHSKQQTLVTSTKGYPRKDDSPLNHQSNQSSYPSPKQPSPILAPSKINHPRESNQSAYPAPQQPSPVTAPSPKQRFMLGGGHVASSQKPSKQEPTNDSDPPNSESPSIKDPRNDSGPPKSQSASSKDTSANGHAAPPNSEECQNFDHKNVARKNDETSSKTGKRSEVEWQDKNIAVPRTQPKPPTRCCSCCCIL
ncbi:hypothetical protein REPUB_Repub13aG0066700 [Reevesia pubescens]